MKHKKEESAQGQKRLKTKSSLMKHINVKWVVTITVLSFFISVMFSYSSSAALKSVNTPVAFVILLVFILLGISFDVIGIAAATGSEKEYHSMAAKRVKGAKQAVWLVRNAEKVSSFCNDVVGDIAGIISGATGTIIISHIVLDNSGKNIAIQLGITGAIAALTIGGKAIGKSFGINYSGQIIYTVGKMIYFFSFFKKNR